MNNTRTNLLSVCRSNLKTSFHTINEKTTRTGQTHMKYRLIFILCTLIYALPVQAVEKIVVNGLFSNKAVVTIDGKQRILHIGKPSPEGVTLISADSKQAVIEVDGEQATYTLGDHIGGTFTPSGEGATVSIAPDRGGMYLVNGSINNYQVKFLVDTGATYVSMSKLHAKRLGISYRLKGIESRSMTASGVSKTYLVNLKKVQVGDITLTDVAGSVHDSNYPDIILLGNSFLNRVNINRDGAMMLLEKK